MSQENVAADNGGRKRIPVEDFVSAWLDTHREGGHIGDVAEKLGLAEGSVSVRASSLKKKLNEELVKNVKTDIELENTLENGLDVWPDITKDNH